MRCPNCGNGSYFSRSGGKVRCDVCGEEVGWGKLTGKGEIPKPVVLKPQGQP